MRNARQEKEKGLIEYAFIIVLIITVLALYEPAIIRIYQQAIAII